MPNRSAKATIPAPTTSALKLLFGALAMILIASGIYLYQKQTVMRLPTYFKYSHEEVALFEGLVSTKEIKPQDLEKWEKRAFEIIKENKEGHDAARLFAYLFTAQRDAAFLSYRVSGKFSGSLDPVSVQVLCKLEPTQCAALKKDFPDSDPYSNNLAAVVVKHIEDRLDADIKTQQAHTPEIPKDWARKAYFGIHFGEQLPWLIPNFEKYELSAPKYVSKSEKREELRRVREAMNDSKNHMRRTPNRHLTPPGEWIWIMGNYSRTHVYPLEYLILARSVVAMTLADTVIATYRMKFKHWIRRPYVEDPKIQPRGTHTPNEPGYPSGHATLAGAAATILSFFFPANKVAWHKEATEISQSRVWDGLHYPTDVNDGFALGEKIGRWAMRMTQKDDKAPAEKS